MQKLDIILRSASFAISMVALLFLFVVVAGNIAGRMIFDMSDGAINLMIFGAIELATYALLILVFGSITLTVPAGLVRVDLVNRILPERFGAVLEVFWLLILAVGVAALSYLFVDKALVSDARGAITQDFGVPLSVFYWAIGLQCAVLAVVSVIASFKKLKASPEQLSQKDML